MEVNTSSTYYVSARRPRKNVTHDNHRRNAADGPDATCNSPYTNVNRKHPIPPFHHGNHNKSENFSTKMEIGQDDIMIGTIMPTTLHQKLHQDLSIETIYNGA